jgi:hypothetical protein
MSEHQPNGDYLATILNPAELQRRIAAGERELRTLRKLLKMATEKPEATEPEEKE